MNDKHSPESAAGGYFILFVLIALMVSTFLADTLLRTTRSPIEINAVFAEAPGLRPGADVWVGGFSVGVVRSIAFLPPSADTLARVIARLEVPQRYRDQIRRDSQVRLTAPSPLGDQVVDIRPGSAAAPALDEGDTLRSTRPAALENVRERAGLLREEIGALASAFDTLQRAATARQPAIERAGQAARSADAERDRLAADLARSPLLTGLRDPAARAQIERIIARSRGAASLVQTRIEQLAGEQEGSVRVALNRLAARTDTLQLRVAELEETVRASGGLPGRLAEDDALMKAIERVRIELDSVVAATVRNPLRYFF